MRITRLGKRAAAVATAAVVASALSAAPAEAHGTKPLKNRSLAAVLGADKRGFDHNGHDYDILTAAVGAVLKAKPGSPVKVLADGRTPVTAFLPNDRAFQLLVKDITKAKRLTGEKKTFTAVAGLGIDTVESVLLYHVVPGATINRKAALKADNVRLKTAAGSSIKVNVYGHWHKRISLIDADRSDRNPRVIRFDINKGNKQIAHGIDRVLRPVNLP
ncbi:fasciclin domain-containing protein [Actinoplanes sp. NPDC049802]|uniref:fasciclin domain-containing protein n=1 Tax=Actinoplanes sp. NPDC049802 TaxID=3154742 RepID=UPI0033C36DC6